MDIDTEIRHVTPAGANIFLDLGFGAVEAEQLHAQSQQEIDNEQALKEGEVAKESLTIPMTGVPKPLL